MTSAVSYTSPADVTGTRVTDVPRSGQTVTGYGGQLPTRYMVRHDGRWKRVYVMSYGNAGSAYVKRSGVLLFLDVETEHKLEGIAR